MDPVLNYHYDLDTGIFSGVLPARESPAEPGEYLLPRGATRTPPPHASAGQVPRYTEGIGWVVVDDTRGVWYGADRRPRVIHSLDEDLAGLVREAPPSPSHDLVDGVWLLNQAEHIENARALLSSQVQKRLDDFARERNYDDMRSACTYALSAIPKFKAEGEYCVQARDQTWIAAYGLLDRVLQGDWPTAGANLIPSDIAEIENDLPDLEWPTPA